jgi:hypothetical protein
MKGEKTVNIMWLKDGWGVQEEKKEVKVLWPKDGRVEKKEKKE